MGHKRKKKKHGSGHHSRSGDAEHSERKARKAVERLVRCVLRGDEEAEVARRAAKAARGGVSKAALHSVLLQACTLGNLGAARALLLGGAPACSELSGARGAEPSALHIAVLLADAPLCALLLQHNAERHAVDVNGETADELGLAELLASHEQSVARAEAAARAASREAEQLRALAAERAAERERWAEKMGNAMADDESAAWGRAAGADAAAGSEEADVELDAPADFFSDISRQRSQKIRQEAAARRQATYGGGEPEGGVGGRGGKSGGSERRRAKRKHRRTYGPYQGGTGRAPSEDDDSDSEEEPRPAAPPPPPGGFAGMRDGSGRAGPGFHSGAAAAAAAAASGPSTAETLADDGEHWAVFAAGRSDKERTGAIGMADVPWPGGGDADPLALLRSGGGSLPAAEQRLAVRLLLRRWHPDKFQQRYGGRLVEAEAEAIMARVKAVAQSSTEAM